MNNTELLKLRSLRSTAMKRARLQGGINKNEFAAKSGITRQTLDRIENDRGNWGVDVEIIYLHTLGMLNFQPIYKEENGKMVVVEMVLMPKK